MPKRKPRTHIAEAYSSGFHPIKISKQQIQKLEIETFPLNQLENIKQAVIMFFMQHPDLELCCEIDEDYSTLLKLYSQICSYFEPYDVFLPESRDTYFPNFVFHYFYNDITATFIDIYAVQKIQDPIKKDFAFTLCSFLFKKGVRFIYDSDFYEYFEEMHIIDAEYGEYDEIEKLEAENFSTERKKFIEERDYLYPLLSEKYTCLEEFKDKFPYHSTNELEVYMACIERTDYKFNDFVYLDYDNENGIAPDCSAYIGFIANEETTLHKTYANDLDMTERETGVCFPAYSCSLIKDNSVPSFMNELVWIMNYVSNLY